MTFSESNCLQKPLCNLSLTHGHNQHSCWFSYLDQAITWSQIVGWSIKISINTVLIAALNPLQLSPSSLKSKQVGGVMTGWGSPLGDLGALLLVVLWQVHDDPHPGMHHAHVFRGGCWAHIR